MALSLHDYLARDHARLDVLVAECLGTSGDILRAPYDEFRRGLLRHIGIEEKILFPLLRKSGVETEVERQLHRDHALFAALLVPPPTRELVQELASLLVLHNRLEEEVEGMYERVELTAGTDLDAIVARAHAAADARVAPNADNTLIRETIEKLRQNVETGRAELRRLRETK